MLEKKLLIFPSLPPSLYLRKMLKAMPCIIQAKLFMLNKEMKFKKGKESIILNPCTKPRE